MSKTPRIVNKVSLIPTHLAFKPRQVLLLLSKPPPTMNNKTLLLKPDQKTLLLHSIAQYLERIGFSKTFKKFRSEAKIEKDDLGGSLFDLEEVFCKFLQMRNYTGKKFESNKLQDLQTDDVSKRHGESDFATAVEIASNRKQKRSDKSNSHAMDKQLGDDDKVISSKSSEELITHDAMPIEVKSKEKKKSKKSSDSLGQEEQVRADVLKEPADNIACESPNKKGKDKKKKKSTLDSEALVANVGPPASESLPVEAEEKSKNLASEGKKVTDSEIENKSKDKKKKKNKLSSDSVVDNVESVSKGKQGADADVHTKSEGKRKRKDSSVSENLVAGDLKEPDGGKPNKIDSKKDDVKTSKEDVTEKQSKASKKRKRFPSEEEATQPAGDKAVEESKRRKTEGSEEPKESEQTTKVKISSGTDEKSHKEESIQVGPGESQKIDGQANGSLKNNGEKSAMQETTKKQQNGSVEPKMVKRFQRVKVDDVVFSDERLRDNSYWAKDGAENGYGAKAQEILEQVRGRDFRHEKTKKKRGAYRGGLIDMQSHSIKFNYSDDD